MMGPRYRQTRVCPLSSEALAELYSGQLAGPDALQRTAERLGLVVMRDEHRRLAEVIQRRACVLGPLDSEDSNILLELARDLERGRFVP